LLYACKRPEKTLNVGAKKETVKKADALRLAKDIGCSGAHQGKDGNWMPCESMEELERISNIAETSKWRTVVPRYKSSERRIKGKNKRRRNKDWENLTEAPIRGIATLADGGLVSSLSFGGKSLDCCGQKGIGPEFVRDNDKDVFIDPESARSRSRQLGCIGISRRISKSGRTVWMPCTNMTDYANTSGSTALGRRNIKKRRENETRTAVRTVLRENARPNLRRKKQLAEELRTK
jgi:hypothetical protein